MPTARVVPRNLALLAILGAMSGCGALSSLSAASERLPSYDLGAAAVPPGPARASRRALLVTTPTATGAIDTDRIVIKPNALQVEYIPDSRWIDAAPDHVQTLLIRSLANSGAFGYVGADPAGPIPDYVLFTDLVAFQTEVNSAPGMPMQVRIRLNLTLMNDINRSVTATSAFERVVPVASAEPLAVVTAFDTAMSGILLETTAWTVRALGGRIGS